MRDSSTVESAATTVRGDVPRRGTRMTTGPGHLSARAQPRRVFSGRAHQSFTSAPHFSHCATHPPEHWASTGAALASSHCRLAQAGSSPLHSLALLSAESLNRKQMKNCLIMSKANGCNHNHISSTSEVGLMKNFTLVALRSPSDTKAAAEPLFCN